MEYAIYNLLTNAVKYSPAETIVTVSLTAITINFACPCAIRASAWTKKNCAIFFEKFYRTKKAEASGEAGTGIGLSIVEQIVHHHGGRMEVTSTPGKGLVFYDGITCRTRV